MYSGKVAVFENNSCIRVKVVVFGKMLFYSGKSGCIQVELLYSDKSGCIREKLTLFGQGCCIQAKVVVFGQKWLY